MLPAKIEDMDASTTASPLARSLEMPPWKNLASHATALFIGAVPVYCAGVYKAMDPYKFANLAKNLLVPYDLTLPLALLLAVAETTAGVLILVPRFRRWGAMLAGACCWPSWATSDGITRRSSAAIAVVSRS